MFATLKRTHTETTSPTSPLAAQTDEKRIKTEENGAPKKRLLMFGPFENNSPVITIEPLSKSNSDLTVKLKQDNTPYEVTADTGLFLVKHAHLGPRANIDDRFHPQPPDTAKFQVMLVKGVSEQFQDDLRENGKTEEEIVHIVEGIKDSQTLFINNIEKYCNGMLEKAWDAKLPLFKNDIKSANALAKKELKKNSDVDVEAFAKAAFLENARTPWNEVCPDEGDAYMAFKATRKYQFTNKLTGVPGEVRRPTLWKKKKSGGFDDITEETKFVSNGSLIYTQVSLSAYTSPVCYGIKANMGFNVIIAHKASKKASSGGSSAAHELSFEALF